MRETADPPSIPLTKAATGLKTAYTGPSRLKVTKMLSTPVCGVEISARRDQSDVHILGLFIDPGDARLIRRLADLARSRQTRATAMVERLRWIADGYDRYSHQQAFDLNLLWHSSTTATALLGEMPELYDLPVRTAWGSWHVALVANWGDRPSRRTLELARLGLP